MNRSNDVGRWKKSALAANNLYDAHILRKYGAFDESDISKTAFKRLFKTQERRVAIQEAVRRQSAIGDRHYYSKRLSERCFSVSGNKRGRFGVRVGFGFPSASLSDFMFIYRDSIGLVGLKRLSLHVDDRWGLEN